MIIIQNIAVFIQILKNISKNFKQKKIGNGNLSFLINGKYELSFVFNCCESILL